MPDTPTLTQSDNREILQGVKENANALHTECKLVPAADLPGLAANLAEIIEWGRMRDTFGLGPFLLTNCAAYNDGISPTICITNADAHRYARVDLGQFELHTLPDFLVYVADAERKPTARTTLHSHCGSTQIPRPNAQQAGRCVFDSPVSAPPPAPSEGPGPPV